MSNRMIWGQIVIVHFSRKSNMCQIVCMCSKVNDNTSHRLRLSNQTARQKKCGTSSKNQTVCFYQPPLRCGVIDEDAQSPRERNVLVHNHLHIISFFFLLSNSSISTQLPWWLSNNYTIIRSRAITSSSSTTRLLLCRAAAALNNLHIRGRQFLLSPWPRDARSFVTRALLLWCNALACIRRWRVRWGTKQMSRMLPWTIDSSIEWLLSNGMKVIGKFHVGTS